MKRIMIDIETLGSAKDAFILEVAAVEFSENGVQEERVYSVNWASNKGRKIEMHTLKWWLTKGGLNQMSEDEATGNHLGDVLTDFGQFVKELRQEDEGIEIWANSPSFDLEILRDAYESFDIEVPWHYYEERDFRTLRNWYDMPRVEYAQRHTALGDAKFQAETVAKLLKQHSNIL